eukprot:TRINITY_DN17607_c0_g1_i5.p8 TRINITY_DN17607_c0_g1~~TRINITY_DN17607_c0_g1_i5.p8  ORF type:complete len:152 (-),score=0.16 TRINITY_DN17607_c0_g1_i5:811-1266(-)
MQKLQYVKIKQYVAVLIQSRAHPATNTNDIYLVTCKTNLLIFRQILGHFDIFQKVCWFSFGTIENRQTQVIYRLICFSTSTKKSVVKQQYFSRKTGTFLVLLTQKIAGFVPYFLNFQHFFQKTGTKSALLKKNRYQNHSDFVEKSVLFGQF